MNSTQALLPCALIGADGMLGRAWHELSVRLGLDFQVIRGDEIDIRDLQSLSERIAPGTRTILNCAAYTDVDGAERDEATANAVNAEGVANLALSAKRLSATLVHYSTDYVFNGRADTPYRPADPMQPVNAYGRSKARGERLLRESGCNFLIVRTSWLYAPWGKNFVRTIAKLARQRATLRIADDQRSRPTSAEHLARTTLELLTRGAGGTCHVTDAGECTWFEFASAIARTLAPDCRIEPCTSEEFKRPAPRPGYSVLDLSETTALLGPLPDWSANLAKVLNRLEIQP